jgi:hypothetical protein
VRRMGVAQFTTAGGQHSESCLVCLTNLGDCIVLSLPELRRQLNAAVIRREDIKYGLTVLYLLTVEELLCCMFSKLNASVRNFNLL